VVVDMVFFGIKFDDPSMIDVVKSEIDSNSNKDVTKILFNVQTYRIDNVLVIYKDFVGQGAVNMVFVFMLGISSIPFFLWGVSLPLFIVAGLMLLWVFLCSKLFNFWMFKILIRKLGHNGSVRLL
jgi:hypothetical protein